MEMDGREKRRHQRVKLPYVMKFRRSEPAASKYWDAVTPINMSESGICFLTVEEFSIGDDIQIHVSNPLGDEELLYDCKVLRCNRSQNRSVFFETVVTIENMSDEAREIYKRLLHAFSSEIAKKQSGL